MLSLDEILTNLNQQTDILWNNAIAEVKKNRRLQIENAVLILFVEKINSYVQKCGHTMEELSQIQMRGKCNSKIESAIHYYKANRDRFRSSSQEKQVFSSAVLQQIELDKASAGSLFDRVGNITNAMLQDNNILKQHIKKRLVESHADRAGQKYSNQQYDEIKRLWSLIKNDEIDRYKAALNREKIPCLTPSKSEPIVSESQSIDNIAAEIVKDWPVIWDGIQKKAIAEGDIKKSAQRSLEVMQILFAMSGVTVDDIQKTSKIRTYMQQNPKGSLTNGIKILSTLSNFSQKNTKEDDQEKEQKDRHSKPHA